MTEIRFTLRQLFEIAAALGLHDDDPAPDAQTIVAGLVAMHVIEEEADRIRLFGLEEGDDD